MARFFDLPAEIRNRIYHLSIPQGLSYALDDSVVPDARKAIPAISRASAQLRQETLPIWRGNNKFWLTRPLFPGIPPHPQIEVELLPHIRSGFQYTQRLRWHEDVRVVGHQGFVQIIMELEGTGCEVHVVRGLTMAPVVVGRAERKAREMVALLETLLDRSISVDFRLW